MPKLPWYRRAILRIRAHAWALRNRSLLHPMSTPHIWVGMKRTISGKSSFPNGEGLEERGIKIPIKKMARDRHIAFSTGRMFQSASRRHQFGHILQKIWHSKREKLHGFKVDYMSEIGEMEELALQGLGLGVPLDITPELARTTTPEQLHSLLSSPRGQTYHPGYVVTHLASMAPRTIFLRAFRKMFTDPQMRPILLEMNSVYSGTGPNNARDYRRWNVPIIEHFQRFYARYSK